MHHSYWLSVSIIQVPFITLQVTELDEDELEVRFLKKVGRDLYMWPKEEDVSWEPRENVILRVQPPQLTNPREQFRFSVTDILAIKDRMAGKTFHFKWLLSKWKFPLESWKLCCLHFDSETGDQEHLKSIKKRIFKFKDKFEVSFAMFVK